MANKAICWDMDETIGSFRKLWIPDYKTSPGLRHGIKDLMQRLSLQGYSHFLTTAGSPKYVDVCMDKSGLRKYFSGIFPQCDVAGRGKLYGRIAEQVKEPSKNMIIIGDSKCDVPLDLDDVVFLEQNYAYMHDSGVIERILTGLSPDFGKGFDDIFNQPVNINGIMLETEKRTRMNLMNNRYADIPVIVISCPDWKKPLQPFFETKTS